MGKWAAALVVVLGLCLQAQNGPQHEQKWDIPHVVIAGLEAYKDKGPDEAVKAWIKDSPLDGNKDALTQANMLRQVQDFYGLYQSFETISTEDLSRRVRVVYLVMNFDKGPLFAKFVTYHSEDHGWVLTSFNFNTKAELILPSKP